MCVPPLKQPSHYNFYYVKLNKPLIRKQTKFTPIIDNPDSMENILVSGDKIVDQVSYMFKTYLY